MADKKTQLTKYTNEELILLKNTFANNPDLMKSIRKALLQLPLTAIDLANLSLLKEDIFKVMRKALCPTITGDEPLLMVSDHFTSISLRDMQPAVAVLHLKAINIWKEYMEQELTRLEGSEPKRAIRLWGLDKIEEDDEDLDYYVKVFARNNIINGVESGLYQLLILGSQKDNETAEETSKRLLADSSK
jgi:hypothetical protein